MDSVVVLQSEKCYSLHQLAHLKQWVENLLGHLSPINKFAPRLLPLLFFPIITWAIMTILKFDGPWNLKGSNSSCAVLPATSLGNSWGHVWFLPFCKKKTNSSFQITLQTNDQLTQFCRCAKKLDSFHLRASRLVCSPKVHQVSQLKGL